jgi:hypothetical protein
MSRIYFVLLTGLLVSSCAAGPAPGPKSAGQTPKKVAVFSTEPNAETRKALEASAVSLLRRSGYDAYEGSAAFAPEIQYSAQDIASELLHAGFTDVVEVKPGDRPFKPGDPDSMVYKLHRIPPPAKSTPVLKEAFNFALEVFLEAVKAGAFH